jgi:hypothetical protein
MKQLRTAAEQAQTLEFNLQNAKKSETVFEQVIGEETVKPMELQLALLQTLMEDNKDTEYGKKYGFSEIRSVEEFQRRVPVAAWTDFEPYAERMMNGEANVLTAYPFDHFNITSGTSGKVKHIPYTAPHANAFAKYNSLCSLGLLTKTIKTDWCSGRSFSPNTGLLTKLPSGLTEGHIPAKIVEYLAGQGDPDRIYRTGFTSPIESTSVEEGKNTRYIHCRFALEDRDVTGINVMYFPNLLTILKYMDDNIELLIHDIETGTIDESIELPPACRESLQKKIKPLPERAAELRDIFRNGTDFPYLPKVFPKLSYIFGCSGGGFTAYDRTVRKRYTGDGLTRIYYGITATEGIFSIPFQPDSVESVLLPGSLFMEFLPVEAEDDFSQIVTMDRVEKGRVYELIITNRAGLYRYRMSDSVEITGWLNNTPTVKFVGRANKTLNMITEKILESDIERLVEQTCKETNTPMFDFCVYPDYEQMRYSFLVEPAQEGTLDTDRFGSLLQKKLVELSDVYSSASVDGRMKPLTVRCLQHDTCLLYRDLMEFRGASAATIKPVHVITTDFQQKFFTRMVV